MNFELTEEQRKAIKSLGRAFKKCKDANVVFYCCLEHIEAFDGNVVDTVNLDKSDFCILDGNHGESVNTHGYDMGAFADDEGCHFVHLIDE